MELWEVSVSPSGGAAREPCVVRFRPHASANTVSSALCAVRGHVRPFYRLFVLVGWLVGWLVLSALPALPA